MTALCRLGKKPARRDPRTLRFAAYARPELPPPPEAIDYGSAVWAWPMYGNDRCGDCTCASAGHMMQAWSASTGKRRTPSELEILAAYCTISGFNPMTRENDDGAVELDVLNYWRKTGIAGGQIAAFVAVSTRRPERLKAALHLFGGLYLGFELPEAVQGATAWEMPEGGAAGSGEPGSWGGHAVNAVAYDPGGLTLVTWGTTLRASWGFVGTYLSEAWAVLSPAWFSDNGRAECGFDIDQLRADLAAL